MIYWIDAAECADRLAKVVFPKLRGEDLDIRHDVFKNNLPSMMARIVYQLAVYESEICDYLESTDQKVKLLREDQEFLIKACRQLDRDGSLPSRS
ncbi:hypothetical protein Asfd1_91 [Aeromonas phage Asfd_1]|nr:hypothetical protein Asfd1_91 [Aeromonas phage Asfd_1]